MLAEGFVAHLHMHDDVGRGGHAEAWPGPLFVASVMAQIIDSGIVCG